MLLSTLYEYINNLRLLSTTNSGDNACKVKIKNQRYLNILIEFSQSRLEHKIEFFFSWNMKKRRIITGVKLLINPDSSTSDLRHYCSWPLMRCTVKEYSWLYCTTWPHKLWLFLHHMKLFFELRTRKMIRILRFRPSPVHTLIHI